MKHALKISLGVAAVGLAVIGSQRLKLPRRRANLEGLEDSGVTQAYDRISRMPQFALMRHITAAYLARFNPCGSLVDIGCGPGLLTSLIARRYPQLRVTGLDTSQEMLHTAAINAAAQGLAPRLDFRLGDAGALQEAGASFDFAVSSLSLHHWSNPHQALDEIYRILAPGGQLLLFDLRRDSRRVFLWLLIFVQNVVLPSAIRRIGEPTGSLLASYTLPELGELLGKSQFEEWKVEGGPVYAFAWARKSSQSSTLPGVSSPDL